MSSKILIAMTASFAIAGCTTSPVAQLTEPLSDGRTELEIFTEGKVIFDINDNEKLYDKFHVDYTYSEYDEEVIKSYFIDKLKNPTWVKFEISGKRLEKGVVTLPLNNKEIAKNGWLEAPYKNTFLMGFDTVILAVNDRYRWLNVYEHLYFDTEYNVDNSAFLERNKLKASSIEFNHNTEDKIEIYGRVNMYKYNPVTNKTWIIVDDDVRIFSGDDEVSYRITEEHYWTRKIY